MRSRWVSDREVDRCQPVNFIYWQVKDRFTTAVISQYGLFTMSTSHQTLPQTYWGAHVLLKHYHIKVTITGTEVAGKADGRVSCSWYYANHALRLAPIYFSLIGRRVCCARQPGGKVELLHVTSKERIIHLFISLIKQAALMHTKRSVDHDLFRE